MLYIFLKLL